MFGDGGGEEWERGGMTHDLSGCVGAGQTASCALWPIKYVEGRDAMSSKVMTPVFEV